METHGVNSTLNRRDGEIAEAQVSCQERRRLTDGSPSSINGDTRFLGPTPLRPVRTDGGLELVRNPGQASSRNVRSSRFIIRLSGQVRFAVIKGRTARV
jgi:hypothetical protein